jgi:hypothetical protein
VVDVIDVLGRYPLPSATNSRLESGLLAGGICSNEQCAMKEEVEYLHGRERGVVSRGERWFGRVAVGAVQCSAVLLLCFVLRPGLVQYGILLNTET